MPPYTVFRSVTLTRLNRLKKSPMASMLTLSFIWNCRAIRMSIVTNLSPMSVLRPRLPGRSESGFPVAVRIQPGKHVETPGSLRGEHRTEFEVPEDSYAVRHLADKRHREAVRNALAGNRTLLPDIRTLRQIRQVGHGVGVV